MYFLSYPEGITAAELKAELVRARVPKAKQFNVADVLGKSGPLVKASHDGKANRWSLTGSGQTHVTEALGLQGPHPEVVNAADGLAALTQSLGDDVARGFIEEALICYQVDARRAAVVFLWSGAMRHLQEKAFAYGLAVLNPAIQRHDGRTKQMAKFEDFSAVRDVTQLLAFREIGLLDKGEWQTLQECLDLRNRCGHPTKYKPRANKVAGFIEDVVGIVF